MTDDGEVDLDYNEAPLKEDQIAQVEAVMGQLRDALADVGKAHIEHQRAYKIYSAASNHLKACEQVAAMMEQQHDGLGLIFLSLFEF